VATEGQDWLRERAGLYHLVCNGWADRYDWALAILDLDPKRGEQVVQSVQRAKSADFAAPARRPAFSALDSSLFDRTFGIRLPDWRDALRSALTLDAGLGDAPAGTV
jgi:dTDP-4-dehydrorhamnose reductase